MSVVSLSQNFHEIPFEQPDFDDVVQTSIGPVLLCFTETEPWDPRMVNVISGCFWFKQIGLKQDSPIMMNQTLVFKKAGWRFQSETPKYDAGDSPIPPAVQRELIGHVSDWVSKNQQRFIEHDIERFSHFADSFVDMISQYAGDMPNDDDVDDLLKSRWATLVTPSAL